MLPFGEETIYYIYFGERPLDILLWRDHLRGGRKIRILTQQIYLEVQKDFNIFFLSLSPIWVVTFLEMSKKLISISLH